MFFLFKGYLQMPKSLTHSKLFLMPEKQEVFAAEG